MSSIAYAALWIFVFSIPWGSVVIIESGVNLVGRLTGMVAVALAVLAVTVSGRFRRLDAYHVAAIAFMGWIVIQQLVFFKTGVRLSSKFWTFVQLLLAVWTMWELAPTRARQYGLMLAYLVGSYVVALDTIRVSRTEGALMRRFAAGGADPNGIAMTLALALPIAWYLAAVYRRPALRWFCRAYLPVGVLALGLTGSRGGMLATMVALMVVPFTMTRLTPARLVSAVVLLAVSGIVAAIYVPDRIVERLATTGTEVQEFRLGGRGSIWIAGIRAFAQKPLMGYGPGRFKDAVQPYGIDQVAHNSFISVLVEEGIVGLLIFLCILLAIFLALLRLPRLERRFSLVLFATLLVAMIPLTMEDNKGVWFIMAALVGVARLRWSREAAAWQPAEVPAPAPRLRRAPVAPRGAEPVR
ncbi:MAG TPA: O-antigen ligase family protein [Gemmatimonadales bacterium]|jgi:O-antigen ligase|nr:O-antigen ligase family protein [Gemmatimonadales bacterium]